MQSTKQQSEDAVKDKVSDVVPEDKEHISVSLIVLKLHKYAVQCLWYACYQTVLSYCLSRVRGDCSARCQNAALKKNHPKDHNHLYGIVLVYLIAFKTRKHFQMAGY